MCAGIAQTSCVLSRHRAHAAPARAFGVPAGAPLVGALPAHVGRVINADRQVDWAHLVLRLEELGMLATEDWQGQRDEPKVIALRALQRFTNRYAGSPTYLRFNLEFAGRYDEVSSASLPYELNHQAGDDRPHYLFQVGPAQPTVYTLESQVGRLEAALQGLGRAVLDAIMRASLSCVHVLTPEWSLQLASDTFWMGADDETEVIEMWRSEGMSEEDIAQSELFRRRDVEKAVPAWALDTEWLPVPVIERFSLTASSFEQAVCSALLAVHRHLARGDALLREQRIEEHTLNIGCALRWNRADHTIWIYDESFRELMESGGEYSEHHGAEWVADDAPALEAFFGRMSRGLQLVAALDRLISLVAVAEEEPSHDRVS